MSRERRNREAELARIQDLAVSYGRRAERAALGADVELEREDVAASGTFAEKAWDDLVLAPQERQFRMAARVFAVFFGLYAVAYLSAALWGNITWPHAAEAVALMIVSASVCIVTASDPRRYGFLLWFPLLGEIVSGLLLIVGLLAGDVEASELYGVDVSAAWMATIVLLTNLAIVVFMVALLSRARVAGARLLVLGGSAYPPLHGIAEAAAPGDALTTEEIVRNVDALLARMPRKARRALRRDIIVTSWLPALQLRPPLQFMDRAARLRFLDRRVRGRIGARAARSAYRLVLLAYYGDRRSHAELGHAPPEAAVRRHDLPQVRLPEQVDETMITADVAIVGSGPAAAVVASRLVQAGLRPVMVEAGSLIAELPENTDDVARLLAVAADGALPLFRGGQLRAPQVRCVGGGDTLSGGRAGRLVEPTVEALQAAGVDASGLRAEAEAVAARLPISPSPGKASPIVQRAGVGAPLEALAPGAVLELLAETQRAAAPFPLLVDCEADRIEHEAGRVAALVCRLPDGRRIRVRAEAVVLAAGALGSSRLALRSGIATDAVGRDLLPVVGCDVFGDFAEPVASEPLAGEALRVDEGTVQIGSLSPLQTAMRLPVTLRAHRELMLRHRHLQTATSFMALAPGAACVSLTSGLRLTLRDEDAHLIGAGVARAAQLLLDAGARSIVLPVERHPSITKPQQLDGFLPDRRELVISALYPLGGLAVGHVVDPTFRVRAFANLFVADGSLLPSPCGPEPQLTVMTLAGMAARSVAATFSRSG